MASVFAGHAACRVEGGVMNTKALGRSIFLASPALMAILPSLILVVQCKKLSDSVLFLGELIRTGVLVAGTLYLAIAGQAQNVWVAQSSRRWYPFVAIWALTITNLFASTSLRILLERAHGELPFVIWRLLR